MAEQEAPTTEAAESAEEAPSPQLAATLPNGTKVKWRLPRQRACNEPDKKKICAGHLKRWYEFGDDVKRLYGENAEIYRCEHCQTLYIPNPEETPRTGTLAY